jgi:hypothetical protein
MTSLRVTDDVFARFPEAVLGIVICHGIDNTGEKTGEDGAILRQLRTEEARVSSRTWCLTKLTKGTKCSVLRGNTGRSGLRGGFPLRGTEA